MAKNTMVKAGSGLLGKVLATPAVRRLAQDSGRKALIAGIGLWQEFSRTEPGQKLISSAMSKTPLVGRVARQLRALDRLVETIEDFDAVPKEKAKAWTTQIRLLQARTKIVDGATRREKAKLLSGVRQDTAVLRAEISDHLASIQG